MINCNLKIDPTINHNHMNSCKTSVYEKKQIIIVVLGLDKHHHNHNHLCSVNNPWPSVKWLSWNWDISRECNSIGALTTIQKCSISWDPHLEFSTFFSYLWYFVINQSTHWNLSWCHMHVVSNKSVLVLKLKAQV